MQLFCSDKVLLFHAFFQSKGVVTQINSSEIFGAKGFNSSYNHIAPKYYTAILCISEGIKLYLKRLQISLLKTKICSKVSFAFDSIANFSFIT